MAENEPRIDQRPKPRKVETFHYPFQDFPHFTEALKNQLVVDTTDFYSPPGQEMPGFEDVLVPYMEKVRFKPDARPVTAVLGRIHDIRVSPESQDALSELPQNLVENVDKKEALATLALAKAKLTVVLEALEDVYPTPPQKAQEYLDAIEFLKDEIVKDKRVKVSLAGGLDLFRPGSPRFNPRFAGLSLLILGGILLSSCAPESSSGNIPPTATDTSPNQPVASEVSLIDEVQEQPTEEVSPPTEAPATPTELPTEVPTEVPTPTEVAPNPGDAIERFDLNRERNYAIQDGYLVDQYNQAKMAKWDSESHEWVDTDLEEKYGHLAPLKPRRPDYYIDDGIWRSSDIIFGQQKGVGFSPFWTGNTFEPTVGDIRPIALEVVFRDGNGVLYRVLQVYDYPQYGKKALLRWEDPRNLIVKKGEEEKKTWGEYFGDPYEALSHFSPGQRLKDSSIVLEWQKGAFPSPDTCYWSDTVCASNLIANYELFKAQEEKLQKFRNLMAGETVELDDDLVIPGSGLLNIEFNVNLDTWSP